MTALRKYTRLESSGLWRETPDARLRDVVVGLREATLVLSDPKTEVALSQWSLPAVERLNPGKMPALYGVGAEDAETLEIDDADMALALDTVRKALERRRPKPGRVRNVALGGFALLVGALALFWLPGKLVDYTAAMLPEATRSELGLAALDDLTKLTGSACATKKGTLALDALAKRLSPNAPLHILVVRDALTSPAHLPGHLVVLPNAILLSAKSPDAVAGYVLAEAMKSQIQDPTRAVLRYSGLLSTLQLLTQGQVKRDALDGFGQTMLAQTYMMPDQDLLLAFFQAAGVSSSGFAFALDATGETTLSLIEADPQRQGSTPAVLEDSGWNDLQAICAP